MTIEETLEIIQKDIENLKLKAFEPSKKEADVFLDFFTWEDGKAKRNFETVYKKELEILDDWLKVFCKLKNCSKEDALQRIIDC